MDKSILFLCCVIALAAGSCRTGAAVPGSHQSLRRIAAKYGFPALEQTGTQITLRSKYTTMVFEVNSRKLMYNGRLVWLNGGLVKQSGHWSVATADADFVIDPLLRSGAALAGTGHETVVVDPGHGGTDKGAISERRVYEKKAVLDISKRVRRKLSRRGIAVKLTRDDDSTLSRARRPARAKQWGADIFVSIHLNSAQSQQATGRETYIMPVAGCASTAGRTDTKSYPGNKHDAANMLLAYHVHKELLAHAKGKDRGVRRARFDVIRDAPCPAVLVECGFISNKTEENNIIKKKHRDTLAEGIAQGILIYIDKVKLANK